ncbi:MAG: SDR family NAD(P)-dependent oxidoreductase [Clostridiales bacterium]|nr:SDR family NAD(P)-dependent oxidoreductase [Clostridiales bacterium]
MNIAIVTGASSGMGKAFVKHLASEEDARLGAPYDEIWMIARSRDKLESLKEEICGTKTESSGTKTSAVSDSSARKALLRVVSLDLTDPSSISVLSDMLASEKPTIRLLINCAGMGRNGAFAEQTKEDTHSAITLNCGALSELTNICLPYMIPAAASLSKQEAPRILNIASSAGFLPQPGYAVYAATKSYVISFSRALSEELRGKNITVTCVCPGPCDTDFIKLSKNDPNATFTGIKARFVTTTDKLIPASLKATKKGKSMLVYGLGQKALHVASKILPTRLILFFERGV